MDYLEFIDKYQYAILIGLFTLSLLFIVFGHVKREQVQLVLKKEFITLPSASIDSWSLLHALLFAFFGFVKPGHPVTFLILGALWEVLEDYLSCDKTTQLADCTNPYNSNNVRKFWCNGIQDDYWYGKWDDVFFNLLGYVIGSSLRETFT